MKEEMTKNNEKNQKLRKLVEKSKNVENLQKISDALDFQKHLIVIGLIISLETSQKD